MQKTLYLMVGYPGSGKTTVAGYISTLTGATHLWADHIRRERFGTPTHSRQETKELYQHMNEMTAELLEADNSVVFDTNFNFRRDRDHLREIAARHGADTKLVWVKTDRQLAKHRATQLDDQHLTRVLGSMHVKDFNRLADHLQEPTPDEHPIILDGAQLTPADVAKALGLETS